MEFVLNGKLKKADHRHAAEVSKQTGFPSPATHYLEPSINLHQELIQHTDATFFVRVEGDSLSKFNIHNGDVLIVDRALYSRGGELALVAQEGDFKVIRIPEEGLEEEITLWGLITYTIHRAV